MMTNIEQIFAGVCGTTFVSIDTVTVPVLLGGKSNPLNGRVKKVQTGSNVMVFQNKTVNGYDAMVRRRLHKEGKNPDTFVLSPRTWGQRRVGSPFVDYNGKLYLEVIFLKAGKVVYTVDDRVVDIGDIPGLPVAKQPVQGGLDNKVIIRTFGVDSIKRVAIDHKVYDL